MCAQRLGDQAQEQHERQHDHRFAGKDETPGVVGGDPAANQRTERSRSAADAAQDAIRQGALAADIGGGGERGDRRNDQHCAKSLDERPADEQHPDRR